ncbi:hypothetical protein H8959_007669, partial [Pygathrix nigripes]
DLHPRIITEGFEAVKEKALQFLEEVKSAEEREKLIKAERKFIEDRGIDPFSSDALSKEGIVALRRAKRRNMESAVIATNILLVDEI